MKTKHVLSIAFLFSCLVLILIVASFNQSTVSAAAFQAQTTPTPFQDDVSVIGSTDGILIMGFIIMLIVLVPVIVYKIKSD